MDPDDEITYEYIRRAVEQAVLKRSGGVNGGDPFGVPGAVLHTPEVKKPEARLPEDEGKEGRAQGRNHRRFHHH